MHTYRFRALATLCLLGCGFAFAGCNNKDNEPRQTGVRPTANFIATDPVFVSSQSVYMIHEHNVMRAWAFGTGRGVTVGLIDGGQMAHEDMIGAYASGGYDFINEDNDPFLTQEEVQFIFDNAFFYYPSDHGTATASLIAARGNNGKGMCGLSPNATVLPIQGFTPDGYSSYDILADGINYARAKRVKVLSMSFGGGEYGSALLEASYRAHLQGMILVAAAGNDGERLGAKGEEPNFYPAGYPWVISVGATQRDMIGSTAEVNRASFSNFGESVDIYVRGRDVTVGQGFVLDLGEYDPFLGYLDVKLRFGSNYESGDGTSFACPQVAGLIAIALELKPDLDVDTIRTLLQQTADELPLHGRKLLNMGRFLEAVANLSSGSTSPQPEIPQVPPRPMVTAALRNALAAMDRGDERILLSQQSRAERQQSLFDTNRRLRRSPNGRLRREGER